MPIGSSTHSCMLGVLGMLPNPLAHATRAITVTWDGRITAGTVSQHTQGRGPDFSMNAMNAALDLT